MQIHHRKQKQQEQKIRWKKTHVNERETQNAIR